MPLVGHHLSEAQQLASPNQDARPGGEMSLIIVHSISLPPGSFGGPEIVSLFTNTLDTSADELSDLEGIRVSSHLLVRRTGELVQFVPFDRRAWHAGESSFHGRECCNDFAIGIELEGADAVPYEPVQYDVLTGICVTLMQGYGIQHIVGHQHVAPGRKTDPGPSFDWIRLQRLLARNL